jgi:outer membrane immunogenic protein
MKKVLLATLAFAALAAAPAAAADLRVPARRPPPPPVYVFSWTGCYIGGNVGGLWVQKDFNILPSFGPDPFFAESFSANASSVAGGLQAGCNYQFAGGWVLGIQGDYDWTDAHLDRAGAVFASFTDSFSVKSVASVTGRVGYAWGGFLGYVKGGAAWERDDLNFSFIPTGAVATLSNTRSGWTVGIGGEYAFTNWVTGFVEYDYYDFGTNRDNLVCGLVACFGNTFGFPVEVRETKSVFKVGLNLLWGMGAGPAVGPRY